jgi:Zn-dependent peptidase ImmA (M78 family)
LALSNNIIVKKAIEFRQENGLNNTEPILLKSILLSNNVLTLFKPLSGSFSGMAIKSADKRFILVNSNHSIGKQHFTIAHELYHLFKQPDFKFRSCVTGRFDKTADINEYHADLFAAELLLPEDGIYKQIPDEELTKDKIQLPTLIKLEQYFSSSRAALLYRLKSLGLISKIKYDEFSVDVKRQAINHGFDTRLYEKGNEGVVIGQYGQIAKELYDKDVISESFYMSLMMDIGKDIYAESTDEPEA